MTSTGHRRGVEDSPTPVSLPLLALDLALGMVGGAIAAIVIGRLPPPGLGRATVSGTT